MQQTLRYLELSSLPPPPSPSSLHKTSDNNNNNSNDASCLYRARSQPIVSALSQSVLISALPGIISPILLNRNPRLRGLK